MSDLLTVTVVALPFVITPGASFTLTLAQAVRREGHSWLPIAAGTALGLLVLALMMGATGLGSVLSGSPTVRFLLGLVGGVLLVVLGAVIIANSPRGGRTAVTPRRPRSLLRWALAAVLTNPKALTLYVVVVPTLSSDHLQGPALFATFAGVHIGLLTGWLLLVHLAASRLPVLAGSARLQRALVIAAGLAMIMLGLLAGAKAVLGQ